jgi:hypothetical protein
MSLPTSFLRTRIATESPRSRGLISLQQAGHRVVPVLVGGLEVTAVTGRLQDCSIAVFGDDIR